MAEEAGGHAEKTDHSVTDFKDDNMARGRMLSKSLGASRKFAATGKRAGEFPQLLYALAISHADDFGRQSGDAFTIKHRVFPTSPRTEEEFDAALVALEQEKLIVRYVANGEQVMQIVKFDDHQQGLHKRTKSEFPAPDPSLPGDSGDSGNFPEIPSELNLTEEKRNEGTPDGSIPKGKKPHPIRDLLALNEHLFQTNNNGEKPAKPTKADVDAANRIIKERGEGKARAIVQQAWVSKDRFIAQGGKSLSFIASANVQNRLVMELAAATKTSQPQQKPTSLRVIDEMEAKRHAG